MSQAKVRFAPSPTGYLHIGSARTALFNWLYAKAQKGLFIIRIEDTDLERSDSKYIDEILSSLKWLGLDWDEEIYYQSKRFDLYKDKASQLVEEGKAYYEETEKGKATRLRIEKGLAIVFYDLVRDKIEISTDTMDDMVILKSDGSPTYNFACVVDDVDMGISHIIRGEDHITNTPRQLLVYQALDAKPPKFAHIPLILGEDKSRMSKRHGATSIEEYKDKGYISSALVNFLSLMGWSPKDDREKLSIEQIVKLFSVKSINKTAAVFNIQKLDWLNGEYIREMPVDGLTDFVSEHLVKKEIIRKDYDRQWLEAVVKCFQTRFNNIDEFVEKTDFLFNDDLNFDEEAKKEHLTEGAIENLLKLKDRFSALEDFTPEMIEGAVRSLAEELGIKAAELIHPARVALTGKTAAPGIFDVIYLINKDRVLKRLESVSS